jgi:hypothetical protein
MEATSLTSTGWAPELYPFVRFRTFGSPLCGAWQIYGLPGPSNIIRPETLFMMSTVEVVAGTLNLPDWPFGTIGYKKREG